MSEETVVEGAETEVPVTPAAEAQPETVEAGATEDTKTEAVTETAATEPERITKTEAEALAKAEAAKAVADLQRSYEAKLQGNAHNAKLAEVLDNLKDQLAGKKPVDPNAIPEGFDYLPEPIQKHLLAQGQTLRMLQEQQALIVQQNAERAEIAIQNNVEAVRLKLANDPKNGKLFEAVEDKIADEIANKPFIKEWVRREPEEALATLFAKHAPQRVAEVTAQAAAAKATAAVRASSRPSSMGGSAPVSAPVSENLDAFDQALKMIGEDKIRKELETMGV